ncbi:MAG: iron-containing alcohol dehydrogenase [Desulfobacterales bacterium]|nr:iron-containing alcohol dehydrogenase [Desulfobacterales bacterium]
MSMPVYFEYGCSVEIVAGHDVLESIPDILDRLGAKRPLIVTDKGVSGAGLVDVLTAAIGARIAIGSIEDSVPVDSSIETVTDLAGAYRQQACDALIAVGGGSVLDTAKGINILVSEESDDLKAFCGSGTLNRPLRPLLAVPTTSGTGSETTLAAVIKDQARHRKLTFGSPFLIPNAAVLDSRMTLTLPPAITAATAMDAMTHAVEAYTCLAKNPLSDVAALTAIKLISGHLPRVMDTPEDPEGRLALALAATIAGMAFGNSLVGMVHCIGHALGAVCGVPHGNCMAMLLPYGLEYNFHRNGRLTADILAALADDDTYARTPREDRADAVIRRIRELNAMLHEACEGRHPRFLNEVRNARGEALVPKEVLPQIARAALDDGMVLFNPEDLDYDDFLMILEHAWDGRPLDRSLVRRGV